MGRPSLSDIVILKRAEEQVAEVLRDKWCKCGRKVTRGWYEDECAICRRLRRRRDKTNRARARRSA